MADSTAGGTFVGNLIREAGSLLSGGILGQGKQLNGEKTDTLSDVLASAAYLASKTPQGSTVIKQSAGTYVVATIKENWGWLLVIGFLIGLLFVSRK